jgi:arabinose-5-phosphate isomerase
MTAQTILASATRTVSVQVDGLRQLEKVLLASDKTTAFSSRFVEAVEAIRACKGRVIVTGMGKSGHVARKIASTFASTGTPSSFVHPAEASHGDLGMVTQDDIILALSWSGEARELADIIAHSRRFKVPLIALTSSITSALGRQADIPLILPKVKEACPNGQAPTTSTTLQMVAGDAIAIALLESRGFSADDFRMFHPGGKLGAQLAFVKSVMHSGDALPLVQEQKMLSDVISVMSAKGFGALVVTDAAGRLTGIVTDGDLRRHMDQTLPSKRIVELMSRNPRTIQEDQLAGEALEILNSHKITMLIVVDGDNRPIGIVHIQDLLKLGVA